MKPPPFAYCAPEHLDQALTLLQQYQGEAMLLAGGQSLMPLLNLRLLRPSVLIDLNKLTELSGCQEVQGQLVVGAMTRQSVLESVSVHQRQPLLAAAVGHIGNFQIRNRGTVGGSLALGHSTGELAAAALLLDAEFVTMSAGSPARTIRADAFFVGNQRTALTPTEMLTSIRFPVLSPHTGWSFQELTQRQGGSALAGTAALVELDATRRCVSARFVSFAVQDRPTRILEVEQFLLGQTITPTSIAPIAATAATLVADVLRSAPCHTDIHASADYRREVTAVLAQRGIGEAMQRAIYERT